jgi:hypothetical protein
MPEPNGQRPSIEQRNAAALEARMSFVEQALLQRIATLENKVATLEALMQAVQQTVAVALSIDWTTRTILVPQSYLTPIGGTLYELDTNQWRLDVLDIMDAEGIAYPDPIRHNTEVTVAGTTFARTIEVINGYHVEFENGAYTVRLAGSNNNLFDVENGVLIQNTVQVIAQNSAGLVVVQQAADMDFTLLRKVMTNKNVTDPTTGIMTVYDDDGVTVLLTAAIYEDAAGTQPYRSRGLERQEKLT